MFKNLFPTPTAGSGLPRANSLRDGRGQGQRGKKLFAKCRHCGYPNNVRATDCGGGTEEDNIGRGAITKTTDTGTLLTGVTFSDTFGDYPISKGAGCACCGRKDSVKFRPSRF